MAAIRSSNAAGSAQLADHAATAALYVTDPMRKRTRSEALAQEPRNGVSPLPAGLTLANASAAASLAHANQKATSPWRPGKQSYAEKAAAFVQNYQSPEPTLQSRPNPDVYKAALFAAQERVRATSSPTAVAAPELRFDPSVFGQHNMGNGNRTSPRESTAQAYISPGALTAATGAVSNRRRTESAPTKPMFNPDATTALTAATISHQANRDSRGVLDDLEPSVEASRIHHIARANVKLYTSTPPVEIEVEEQKHRDTLRAAAISMARDMYATSAASRAEVDEVSHASIAAQKQLSNRYSQSQFSWAPGDEYNMTPQRTLSLHEAAQKIAAEKLAKMQNNELYNKQQYYGTATSQKSRQSLTRRLRRRTSSEGDASKIDWERSERIRDQMSSLQNRMQQIDEKKSKDRADLMEVARRNVNAAIQDLDDKVYAQTGKPSPTMQQEWEEKAQERARQESELRMTNFGRVSVGGQKYMDQTDVDAIARSRIQPTLDGISTKVEEQKAREVEKRLEQERKQRQSELEREREAEIKAEKKNAAQEKSKENENQLGRRRSLIGGRRIFSRTSRIFSGKKTGENDADHAGREQEREHEQEEPAVASTQGGQAGEQPEQEAANASTQATEHVGEPGPEVQQQPQEQVVSETAEPEPTTTSPTSPKQETKLRSWIRGKLPRRFSKPPPQNEEKLADGAKQDNLADVQEGQTAADRSPRAAPLTSNPVTESDLAPVAVSSAENQPEGEDAGDEEITRQWSSSSEHSTDENDSRRQRLRRSFRDMIMRRSTTDSGSTGGSPLRSPTVVTTSSMSSRTIGTTAMSRPAPGPRLNTMERIELRDSFTEETLPPPPSVLRDRRSISSSARDSKFFEDL